MDCCCFPNRKLSTAERATNGRPYDGNHIEENIIKQAGGTVLPPASFA